jgi:CheY-like chemotaxis protein/HPt (histidine-containing phosphotransfer) domain-containing protein
VSITDTGIGIPQEKLSRIFSPFEQSDPEITSKYGGTGLGLSISSYIVQSMGGTISVESTPGKGSRFYFTITLPEAEMSSETTHEPAPRKTHKLGAYNLHALVAEDTPDSLELIIAMLAKLGITADPSTNGEEAFDLFTRNKYDVVILDGFMPKMDGNETARKIRDLEKTNNIPRTPIIALSAKVLRSEVEEFLRSGVDTFVAKPVTFPALEDALKNAQRSLMPSAPVKSHSEVERRPFIAQISSFLGVSEDIVEKTMRKFAEMTLPEALQEIKASMEPFDSERLVRAAHKLKGASLSLMLKEISDECATLEFLARNQLITEAKTTVDKIEQESHKLKEFLLSDNNFT